MAITTYEKNGKTYFRVYVQDRSKTFSNIRIQRSKAGITTIVEARREEKKLTRHVYELIAQMESKGITWKEIIHRWEICAKHGLAGRKYTRESVVDHVCRLYTHTPTWLDKRVKDLGRSDGRYVINSLLDKSYTTSTIKGVKSSISKVWSWGVEEGLIQGSDKSPVQGIVVEGAKNNYKPILTIEEIRKLLLEAELQKHPWRHVWSVAVLTGMRSGELLALQWEDVDFENNLIRITKSYSSRIKAIKSTKNAEWRNAHISDEPQKGSFRNQARLIQIQSLSFIISVVRRQGSAGLILRNFLKRIGIEKYVTFHTLRACFATHVLASGAEPTQVMKMGGWADFKTFQIYIRMAGVDVKGVTDDFRVTPELGLTDNVLKLR